MLVEHGADIYAKNSQGVRYVSLYRCSPSFIANIPFHQCPSHPVPLTPPLCRSFIRFQITPQDLVKVEKEFKKNRELQIMFELEGVKRIQNLFKQTLLKGPSKKQSVCLPDEVRSMPISQLSHNVRFLTVCIR